VGGRTGDPRIPTARGERRILNGDAIQRLQSAGLYVPGRPLRLHLGCGEVKLDGYVNVDYPPTQHSVQSNGAADLYADILDLHFPDASVDEIRLHHVFEHFDRPTAHALIGRWHQWLKPGGALHIETPDLRASLRILSSKRRPYRDHQVVLRHLFGSHEAAWAVHWDGWYAEKYERVLGALGFGDLRFTHSSWGLTHNVTVQARKHESLSAAVLCGRIVTLLRDSLVDESASEQKLWGVWCDRVRQLLPSAGEAPSSAPEVTIFVPVYNRERYLAETLDSLLKQTFRNFEVVIADDGSTDGTPGLAREYAARDPRVRVLTLPHRGEVAARNAAVQHAHPASRFLMNHDSDDISLPTKLERLVTHLRTHGEIGMVGSFASYFDDAGNDRGAPPLECEPGTIAATFERVNSLVNSATLIRREVFESVGGYRQEYASVDDYDFFARALTAGYLAANIPETLHRIRLHPGSISNTRIRRTRLLVERVRSDYAFARGRRDAGVLRRTTLWLASRLRRARAAARYYSGELARRAQIAESTP
jgi:glycosyltransferase involved in cell wall biosynthesis/predicted SAM-dependent methyltransferase